MSGGSVDDDTVTATVWSPVAEIPAQPVDPAAQPVDPKTQPADLTTDHHDLPRVIDPPRPGPVTGGSRGFALHVLSRRHVVTVAGAGLAALVVFVVASRGGKLEAELTALIIVAAAGTVARKHAVALCVLLVTIAPFQVAILSFLFHAHGPASLIRAMGFGKELIVACLVSLALGRAPSEAARRWDALGRTFLALGLLYLVVPQLVPALFETSTTLTRVLGWRSQSLGILAALAIARLSFSTAEKRKIANVVIIGGTVMAACAIWEALSPNGWNSFIVTNFDPSAYRGAVLGTGSLPGESVINHTFLAGHDTTRAGSFTFSSITLPFYLLVCLGLAFSRAISSSEKRMWVISLLLTAGILVSQTRSALFGLAAAFVVALLRSRNASARTRALGLLLLGGFVMVRLGFATYLVDRVQIALAGKDVSAKAHQTNSRGAIELFLHHPAGLGWGVAPGNDTRGDGTVTVTAEDAFLQLGVELGWIGLGVVAAFVVTTLRALGRVARGAAVPWLVDGALFAVISISISGFFLHVFEDFSVSLTLWPIVGLALAHTADAVVREPAHSSRLTA